jgi:hypothetical protein
MPASSATSGLRSERILQKPQRVLVSPNKETRAVDLAYALHKTIMAYRTLPPKQPHFFPRSYPFPPHKPGVSPLEDFVAISELYFEELIRIVLPMTFWWYEKDLTAIQRKANRSGRALEEALEQVIKQKLGLEEDEVTLRQELMKGPEDQKQTAGE